MQSIYRQMFAGAAPYRYVEYPKVVRDGDGYELGTATDADHEAELRAKGRKSGDPVDLERDEIAQVEGVFFVNGAAATELQTAYIKAARKGAQVAQATGVDANAPVPELADAPTQHPDGTPIKRGPGRPSNAEIAARKAAGG